MPRYLFAPAEKPHRTGSADGAAAAPSQSQTRMERDFPQVLATIQSMWGYPELNLYFSRLTLEREKREGFPADVWDDIHLLWQLHQDLVPDQLPFPGAPCA